MGKYLLCVLFFMVTSIPSIYCLGEGSMVVEKMMLSLVMFIVQPVSNQVRSVMFAVIQN